MNNPWRDIVPPQADVAARRIDHTHELDLFYARDALGRCLFVYEHDTPGDDAAAPMPELEGIQTAFHLSPQGRRRLVITLKEEAYLELFAVLCQDIVQATRGHEDAEDALAVILRRLAKWQQFLKVARTGLLSEEVVKGLIGELLVLRDYLIPNVGASAVRFWTGPEGAAQDFCLAQISIEVKCHSAGAHPTVTITSADQLCAQTPLLYLCVVTLGPAMADQADALSLPTLAEDISRLLEAKDALMYERFHDLLYRAGYVPSDRYLDFSYVPLNNRFYEVREGFPRLCPTDLRPGIVRLSYAISLEQGEAFLVDPDWREILQ